MGFFFTLLVAPIMFGYLSSTLLFLLSISHTSQSAHYASGYLQNLIKKAHDFIIYNGRDSAVTLLLLEGSNCRREMGGMLHSGSGGKLEDCKDQVERSYNEST